MNCKLIFQIFNLCCIIFFTLPTHAESVNNFILDKQTVPTSLGSNMVFLEDAKGLLSFDEIQLADSWTPTPRIGLSKGFTKSTFWLRFSVENTLDTDFNWNLEFAYPLLDEIEFYQPNQTGSYNKKLMGDHQPFSDREIHYRNVVVPITAQAKQTNTYFVRIKTTSSMNALLKVWPNNTFYQEVDSTKFILGILYGVILLALITSLVNSFYLKDPMYLWLCLSILNISLYLSGVKGISFQYLWPNSNWWSEANIPFFVNFGYVPVLQYTRLFMSLKDIAPRLDKLFVIFIWLGVIEGICSLFISYGVMIRLCTISASLMSILCITAGCYAWYKGNKSSRFYVFSWLIWFIGSVTFALTAAGILPRSLLTAWSQEVGFFFFVILMTIAQFDRFLQTLRSHEKGQQSVLNALSKAEEEYRSLFENAIEGIFKLDNKGRLNNANKTFLDITSVKELEAIKLESYQPFSLCFLDSVETEKFKNYLSEETSISDYVTSFKDKEAVTKWVSLSVQQLEDTVDKSVSYRGSLTDITETKKHEYAEKKRHMAEASTQAKEQFIANMSQEIRSPVSSIIDYTNQVSEINTNSEIDSYLLRIKRYSANLLGTINDILDFSDMEAGKLVINYAPFNIRQLLDNMSHVVGDSVDEKNLELTIEIDEDIPELLIGDSVRLNQILINLTNNAVKFTDQGFIQIALELVSLNKKSGNIIISGSVSDSGKGISTHAQSLMFETQINPDQNSNRSSGFGLSITKQLLELMDGDISLSSVMGQGSIFTFQFTCRIESREHTRQEQKFDTEVEKLPEIDPISTEELPVINAPDLPCAQEQDIQSDTIPTRIIEVSLDQEDGLERCQGNQKLYLKLFTEFIRNYESTAKDMSLLLENKDLLPIAKLAHTLKGLSANLGAKKLSKLAVSLENVSALNEQEQTASLQLFETELKAVIDEMTLVLNSSPEDFIEQSSVKSKYLEHELNDKIKVLSAMVHEQKMGAYDEALSMLARWPISEHEPLLTEIAELLDLFDFENATKSIEELIKIR
jgi:PAS domain S-box-containing protein